MFVCVSHRIHSTPAIAPGKAIRMIIGSIHDWKFTAMSRYTSTIASSMPHAIVVKLVRIDSA